MQAALSPGSLPDEAKIKCETAIEKVLVYEALSY
jgi:hypothetical protein